MLAALDRRAGGTAPAGGPGQMTADPPSAAFEPGAFLAVLAELLAVILVVAEDTGPAAEEHARLFNALGNPVHRGP